MITGFSVLGFGIRNLTSLCRIPIRTPIINRLIHLSAKTPERLLVKYNVPKVSFSSSTVLRDAKKSNFKPISTRVKGATWATFLLFASAGVGVTYYYLQEKEKTSQEQQDRAKERQTMSVGKPRIGGPFSLIDENGVRRTNKDFLGKFMLVYFGFTFCPDICPIELSKMGDALTVIEKGPNGKALIDLIQPIFISVDPKRDTIEEIKKYTKEFHPKLLGMTGTKDEIAEAAKAYRVYFSSSQVDDKSADDDYLVDHSIFIYLMGPDGELVDYYGQNKTTTEITESLKQYLSDHLK